MTTVFVLFSGYTEDYYHTETFVDVFATHENAQTYIDGVIRQRKLDCKRNQLAEAFGKEWDEKNPWLDKDPWAFDRETKPKYRHDLAHDKEYNRRHAASVHEWRANISVPFHERMRQHQEAKQTAIREYMATIDMEQQDLSEIDLAYYGKEDNFIIKPAEVKG
jgi:hypothetical protein